MKEWNPERDFGKADFSNRKKQSASPLPGSSERRPPPELPIEKPAPVPTTDLKPGRVVKAWRPPDVGQAKDPAATRPLQKPGPLTETPRREPPPAFQRLKPGALAGASSTGGFEPLAESAGQSTRGAETDLSSALLEEMIVAQPREAADLLRRWYWEKPLAGGPSQEAHSRIFILLHSIRKDLLVDLYRYFTAMERRQMQEIYSKRRTVVKSEVLSARRQFMDSLAGQ